jgi:hypothetical protein
MIIDHRNNDEYLELARLDKVPQGLGLFIPLDKHLRFKEGGFNIILGHAHEHDYETSSKLRIFAKKTKTAVYVCMHASTEALRKVHPVKHDYEGLPIPPSGADAEGGGKWINRCDDFITIHRYTQSQSDWMWTQIHVKKVKETETGGAPTFLSEPVMFKLDNGTKFMCGGLDAVKQSEYKPKPLTNNFDFE